MSPPELAGDAPIPNVPHPFEIDLGIICRHELGSSLFNGSNSGFCKRLYLNKPLRGEKRLDSLVTSLAMTDVVDQRFGPGKKTAGFQIRQYALSRLVAIQSSIWTSFRSNFRVLANHADLWQAVALSHLKICRIVRRRNLHSARAE